MTTVPAALFEPDKSRYNANATDDILNVVPQADGYGPLPSLKPFVPAFEVLTDEDGNPLTGDDDEILIVGPGGTTLSGEVALPGTLGGIFVRLTDGTTALIVGTETGLYKLNTADYTWEDVSGPSAPYSVGAEMRWSFALFGTTVYAQNFSDPEQMFDLATDSAFSDNATAPICAYLASIGDWLLRGRLLSNEDAVQWCGLNDPTSNEAGIDFSDIQVFAEGSGVRGLIPVSGGVVVLMRDNTQALTLNYGSNYVFTRSVLNKYRGCIAPYSAILIGQDDYIFYSQDGWFRGPAMTPIGAERVDRWYQETVNFEARVAAIAGVDFRRKMYWVRFQMSDGSYRMLGYQWQLDRWTLSDADMADMFGIEAQGVTIDQMDSFFPTIDDIDVPYDSSFWQGGSPDFAGMNSDGFLAPMNGAPMAARLATNDLTPGGIGRAFVNGGHGITDAVNFTATHSTANYKGATFTTRAPVSPTTRGRFLSFRGDGHAHRFLVDIPEGEDWSIFSGIDVDSKSSGKS
jgi:hypothetical protein